MALLFESLNLEITVHYQSHRSVVGWIECLHVNETEYLGSITDRVKLKTIKIGIHSFAARHLARGHYEASNVRGTR